MKHLRVTVDVDTDAAPVFFTLLADSPSVSEARVLDWNEAREEFLTLLYEIDGDTTRFRTTATETPGVESVDLSETDERSTYALVEARPRAMPMFGAVNQARARGGLVVRKPIVYRDGTMSFRVVGNSEPLQVAFDQTPDAMDVRIDEIATLRGGRDRPAAALTDRQREALVTARDLGYYDRPRDATHADVADELDCAPATASALLQKAEAKLVDGALDGFDSEI